MSDSSSGAERRFHPLPALLAAVHAGWIWWLSSDRRDWGGTEPIWGFLGNSFHFPLFGGLAILVAEALRRRGGWSGGRIAAVLAIVLGYGILDELHQRTVAGRSADPADALVDLLGGVGALALWWGVRGPGRFGPAFLRAFGVGLAMLAFNAWRTWGGSG